MGAPRRGGARRWQWRWRAVFQGAGRRVGARIGVEWRGEGPERVLRKQKVEEKGW